MEVLSPVHRPSRRVQHLREHLPPDQRKKLRDAILESELPAIAAWTLAQDAVDAYLAGSQHSENADRGADFDSPQHYREEIACLLLLEEEPHTLGPDVKLARRLEGLAGDHAKIRSAELNFHYHDFLAEQTTYRDTVVPRFEQLRATKHELLIESEKELRTQEFKPRVLTSFVRNKLIDDVYLPLIGDNLAKQMGAAGGKQANGSHGALAVDKPTWLRENNVDGVRRQPFGTRLCQSKRACVGAQRDIAGSFRGNKCVGKRGSQSHQHGA